MKNTSNRLFSNIHVDVANSLYFRSALPIKCKSHVKFKAIFKLIAICEIRKTFAAGNLRNYTHLACDFM